MYKIYAFVALLAIASVHCAEKEEREHIPILKSEIQKHEDGSYNLAVETGDGTSRNEDVTFTDETLEVKGSYKYLNEDGDEVEVFYTAGVNGFVPYGSVINPEISAVAEAAKDLPKHPEDEYENKKKALKE